MKISLKRSALPVLLLLLGATSQPIAASAQDQIVKLPHLANSSSKSSLAFQVVDSYQKGFSALYASNNNGIIKFCKGLEELGCETGLSADTVLPICESSESPNCIESFSTISENFSRKKLTYLRSITTKDNYVYESSIKRGLPAPGQISLWKDETQEGNNFYSVNASLALKSTGSGGDLSFQASDLAIDVNQYVERAEAISTGIGPMQGTSGAGWNPPTSVRNFQCAWHEVGLCGVSQTMDINQRFEITLHVSNTISGWIYGRLRGQVIDIQTLSADQNRITISGSAVEIPGILVETDYSRDSQLVKEFAQQSRWTMPITLLMPMTQFVKSDAGDSSILTAFSSVLNDKAQYSYTKWSIYTKPFLNAPARTQSEYKLRECIGNEQGVQGFVTSNAPIYESAPPVFDGESLNYKVSGTHFKSDGSLFEGSYDLSIRSSLARCIYGFSSAPISASVSVLNSDGETTVKTTTFNETTNGWMNFSAAGFTFSSPTIKIVLNQERSPEPLPTPEQTVTKKKNKTILCQKKKTVKKISGINPKCPTGYKKAN